MAPIKTSLAAIGVGALMMGSAIAAPVTFDITGGGFTLGSGFGCGNSNSLLCVTTSYTLGNPAPFQLSAGGSQFLTFGTVTLNDDDNNLQGGETDNLTFTVFLDFSDPISGQVGRVATTGTTTGQFSDAGVDLEFTFDPVTTNFGTGGSFTVAWDSMFFAANPQTVTQNVRITLDNEPREVQVPEPASLALLGMGLLGLGMLRRRKSS